MRLFIPVLLMCLAGVGCGRLFEDNGTHLAYLLERGAGELRASRGSELVLRYTTLDAPDVGYYVEITPSEPGQESNAANSYLVVFRENTRWHELSQPIRVRADAAVRPEGARRHCRSRPAQGRPACQRGRRALREGGRRSG